MPKDQHSIFFVSTRNKIPHIIRNSVAFLTAIPVTYRLPTTYLQNKTADYPHLFILEMTPNSVEFKPRMVRHDEELTKIQITLC